MDFQGFFFNCGKEYNDGNDDDDDINLVHYNLCNFP